MALSVIEQKKAHAAVWRRVHADVSIRNFEELAGVFDQPVEWVMDALGRDVSRVSKLLKERRGTPRVRHEWRKERAWSRIQKQQSQGRVPATDLAAEAEAFDVMPNDELGKLIEVSV